MNGISSPIEKQTLVSILIVFIVVEDLELEQLDKCFNCADSSRGFRVGTTRYKYDFFVW